MKKTFLGMALVAMMTVMPAMAQNQVKKQKLTPEQRVEKVAEMQAKRLMLDDATKAKFIPLYKEYMAEMQQNSKKNCPMLQQKEGASSVSDDQLKQCMEQCFDQEQKRLDIRKAYYKKFQSVLNMKQIHTLMAPGKNAQYGKKGAYGKKHAALHHGKKHAAGRHNANCPLAPDATK